MKIGLVGCGDHATSSHGPSLALYRASHPDLALVGCADPAPGRTGRRNITLSPKRGTPVVLEARRPAAERQAVTA